jgi:4'-phosphopantetheinyl transferase
MKSPKLIPPDIDMVPISHLSIAPILEPDDLHLWCGNLDSSFSRILELKPLLSADECEKAHRFHFTKDSNRSVASRGLLRTLLGHYLQRDPSRLKFCYGTYGKPRLDASDSGDLCFNVAHSDWLGVFAFTRAREIGIDVERIQPDIMKERIADEFFSAREVDDLLSVPVQEQAEAFFNCWTRKEAFLKAKGSGLSAPLDQFSVSLKPGETPSLIETQWDEKESSRWSVLHFEPEPGFVGSVVMESSNPRSYSIYRLK